MLEEDEKSLGICGVKEDCGWTFQTSSKHFETFATTGTNTFKIQSYPR